MAQKALLVGGCPAPYHRLEPAEPPLRAALESLGLETKVTGIFHPRGDDAYVGDYGALTADSLAGVDLLVLYTTGKDRHGADIDAILRYVESGKAGRNP